MESSSKAKWSSILLWCVLLREQNCSDTSKVTASFLCILHIYGSLKNILPCSDKCLYMYGIVCVWVKIFYDSSGLSSFYPAVSITCYVASPPNPHTCYYYTAYSEVIQLLIPSPLQVETGPGHVSGHKSLHFIYVVVFLQSTIKNKKKKHVQNSDCILYNF